MSLFEIFNLELINFYISNINITYHWIEHNNHITKMHFYGNEYALLCTTNRTLFKKNRLEWILILKFCSHISLRETLSLHGSHYPTEGEIPNFQWANIAFFPSSDISFPNVLHIFYNFFFNFLRNVIQTMILSNNWR